MMVQNSDVRNLYKIFFITILGLGLFYPSIFAGTLPIDDQQLLHHLLNVKTINWHRIFLRNGHGYYYRPLLYTSFLLDEIFMGSHPVWMHFVNILLHTINGVLVFNITKSFLKIFPINCSKEKQLIPFLSSILFLCNPIVTESVNWISGRSDLLSGTFALLSLFILLEKGQSTLFILVSGLFFFLSMLSKEVGFALFPVVLLFLYLTRISQKQFTNWRPLTTILTYIGFIIFYVMMRFGGGRHAPKLVTHVKKAMISGGTLNVFDILLPKLKIFVVAYGFYMKKLLYPLPLNFAIVSINMNLYEVFGILSILGTLLIFYLLLKKQQFILFFAVFSILFFIPALPVALYQIAWTPLAERYLYLSSVGFAVILSYLLCQIKRKYIVPYLIKDAAIIFLFVLACVVTYNRNLCWQSSLSLYKDTIKKSPSFAPIRNDYAIVLKRHGYTKEALAQFQIAKTLCRGKQSRIENNLLLAKTTSLNANIVAAKLASLYDSTKSKKIKQEILNNLLRALGMSMETRPLSDSQRENLIKTMIHYNAEGYRLFRDPFYLYRQGQLFLMLGEKEKAKVFFHQVCSESSDFFTSAACKLDQKLSKELASNE